MHNRTFWKWCVLNNGPSPPHPTPIEPGGTYACSPSPEPPYLGKRVYPLSREKGIPPISGKGYTPLSRVLVTIGNLKNTPLFRVFSENLLETAAKNTRFPEKWGGGGGRGTLLLLYPMSRVSTNQYTTCPQDVVVSNISGKTFIRISEFILFFVVDVYQIMWLKRR